MPKYADLVGQRFGRLTVIRKTEERHRRSVIWECICDCGQHKNVSTDHLRRSVNRSCGCAFERKARYESVVGELIPDGHSVVFLDGNTNNWEKSNLYHISNATRMKMLRRNWFSDNAEHTLSAIKICELETMIKAKEQSL